jgi:putative ubiquitin-RnfH superfamily antitoxin RatB of RatAB toxin-antitoxin module
MADKIRVEVVYASPEQQTILNLVLPANSTIRDAIVASKLFGESIENLAVGIFGRQRELDNILKNGDRVEIYRPLINDPKLARWQRAQRDRKAKGTKK